MNRIYSAFGVVCTFFTLSLFSPVWADPVDLEQTFDVKSGGTLYLKSDVGSIDLQSHNDDSVLVQVEVRGQDADDFEVSMTQSGDDVRVVGKRSGYSWGRSGNARFTIKVPQNYNVDLRTGGGSVEVSNLTGRVDIATSGGSIDLGKIQGDVDARTSGGSIRVDQVVGNIDAHTSGGSINATLASQPDDDCRLTTSGGSITVYVLPDIAVDLRANTSGGRVRSELAVDGSVRKTNIRGEINGGGPELFLNTSGGSVNVRKL